MAEVKFSGIGVVNMNGSVGSTTFARNAYGTYAKGKIGAPASTPFLIAWQNDIASIANVWEFGMTEADRLAWYQVKRSSVDSMSDKNTITGFNLFMSVNINRFLTGTGQTLLPPQDVSRPQISNLFISTLNPLSFRIRTDTNPAIPCHIYATRGLPVGRMSMNQIYTYITTIGISTSPSSIFSPYSSRLVAPVSGTKVFIKAIPIGILSGLRGVPKFTSAIVA